MQDTDIAITGLEDWAQACADFRSHWMSLRDRTLMPTAERYLDAMQPRFAPSIYITEVTEDAAIVRFQGTALVDGWGFDVTGKDVCTYRSERLRASVLKMMKVIVRQPCGYFCRCIYTSAKGRNVTADIIRLPLAVRDERPPRIVNYKFEDMTLDKEDVAWVSYKNTHQGWIDIGAGIPNNPPIELIE